WVRRRETLRGADGGGRCCLCREDAARWVGGIDLWTEEMGAYCLAGRAEGRDGGAGVPRGGNRRRRGRAGRLRGRLGRGRLPRPRPRILPRRRRRHPPQARTALRPRPGRPRRRRLRPPRGRPLAGAGDDGRRAGGRLELVARVFAPGDPGRRAHPARRRGIARHAQRRKGRVFPPVPCAVAGSVEGGGPRGPWSPP
ncbi:hypothetical protein DFJ74DRAFT_344742, partial [Hyaloraphidium curvatum]